MKVVEKMGSSLRGGGLKPVVSESRLGDWHSASRANTRLRAAVSECSFDEVVDRALGCQDSTSQHLREFLFFRSRDKSVTRAAV